MNCLKCKKYNKEKNCCEMNMAHSNKLECYLKMLYSAIRELDKANIEFYKIYADAIEGSKEYMEKQKKIIDKLDQDMDKGEEWREY